MIELNSWSMIYFVMNLRDSLRSSFPYDHLKNSFISAQLTVHQVE